MFDALSPQKRTGLPLHNDILLCYFCVTILGTVVFLFGQKLQNKWLKVSNFGEPGFLEHLSGKGLTKLLGAKFKTP